MQAVTLSSALVVYGRMLLGTRLVFYNSLVRYRLMSGASVHCIYEIVGS